jgi:hypothetical protein
MKAAKHRCSVCYHPARRVVSVTKKSGWSTDSQRSYPSGSMKPARQHKLPCNCPCHGGGES